MNDRTAKALKRAHREAGGTNASLARALGLTPQAVGKWLLGESRPSLQSALDMERLYGIKAERFRPDDGARIQQLRKLR